MVINNSCYGVDSVAVIIESSHAIVRDLAWTGVRLPVNANFANNSYIFML